MIIAHNGYADFYPGKKSDVWNILLYSNIRAQSFTSSIADFH